MIRLLQELGYSKAQLNHLYQVHQFMSVEEAMQLLEIDPSTGKYPHRFMPVWKSKLVAPVCAICKDSKNKHLTNAQYLLN